MHEVIQNPAGVQLRRAKPGLIQRPPKDCSEQESTGYRNALNLIHTSGTSLQNTPDLIKRLHKLCQDGGGDAGEFKRFDKKSSSCISAARG